jgi:membrane-associated phospholipid phosphatase
MEMDGATVLEGAGYLFSAPIRWEGGDWLTFGISAALTVAAASLDNAGRTLMQKNQQPSCDRLEKIFVEYGSGLNMMILSAGGYAAGLAFGDDWLRETSMLTGSAIIVAGTISTVMKIAVGRARPYLNEGHLRFKPFYFPVEDYASFPSGHTIVAFAVSGVLAERIKNPWASIGLYAAATATALSRMYSDNHWFSDVVCGAMISIAISRSLVQWIESGKGSDGSSGVRLVPRGSSVALVWTF